MRSAEAGDILAGRYRLRAVIGRGGMGLVWLAGDELLHRDVAVKEILWPPQLGAGEREKFRQRGLREARAAARLNHLNVVRVYDVIEDDGRPWVVMQLVPYPSLGDVVHADGPLPPERAARAGLQILDAIRAAHAFGVLHRDVKPGNVLLGPGDHVVLTDFGVAIADGSPTLTTSGIVIGSPSCMAPERARGHRATPAADLWSLGATLYAAVEGRPPFDRDGTKAVLTAVVSDDPDPPRRAGPLWPVISGLLTKDPDARPDAGEVERLLRRVAGERGAVPASTAELTTPPGAVGHASSSHGGVTGEQGIPPAPAPPASTVPQPEPQASAAKSNGLAPALIPGLDRRPDIFAREVPEPAAPGPGGASPRARPRRRWPIAAIGSAIAVAVIAAILGVAFGRSPAHRVAASGAPKGSHATNFAPAPSRLSPSPAPSTGSGPGALPAGFSWYHDPTGFSIGVPPGWQISHQGHYVYVKDPNSNRFLIIDQTTHPKPDPLADWRQQEPYRISISPGYHRIRLQAVHYPQAEKAADWEFTFYAHGQLTHVLNRNILVSAHHAYALYWSTPESAWGASFSLFEDFAATFRPVA